jgi:hypothetical protein
MKLKLICLLACFALEKWAIFLVAVQILCEPRLN